MENKTSVQDANEWMENSDVQSEYALDQAQAQKEREAAAKYLKLKDKEQLTFKLTGRTRFYEKTFEGSPDAKKMYDFELAEQNSKGENKIFSISSANPACGELLTAIANKQFEITIKRVGTAKATTYIIIAR